jgi:hypothetical protein
MGGRLPFPRFFAEDATNGDDDGDRVDVIPTSHGTDSDLVTRKVMEDAIAAAVDPLATSLRIIANHLHSLEQVHTYPRTNLSCHTFTLMRTLVATHLASYEP